VKFDFAAVKVTPVSQFIACRVWIVFRFVCRQSRRSSASTFRLSVI